MDNNENTNITTSKISFSVVDQLRDEFDRVDAELKQLREWLSYGKYSAK